MKEHFLKCWPSYFSAIFDGIKQFEVRKNDRDFKVGDILLLREWQSNPNDKACGGDMTGRTVDAEITYVLPGGQFGIDPGYAVLGIKLLRSKGKES